MSIGEEAAVQNKTFLQARNKNLPILVDRFFGAPQHDGTQYPPHPIQSYRHIRLFGNRRFPKRTLVPGFVSQKLEQGIRIFERILDDRPRDTPSTFGPQQTTGPGGNRGCIFDAMRFVQNDTFPRVRQQAFQGRDAGGFLFLLLLLLSDMRLQLSLKTAI
jgi:hypothetical protein